MPAAPETIPRNFDSPLCLKPALSSRDLDPIELTPSTATPPSCSSPHIILDWDVKVEKCHDQRAPRPSSIENVMDQVARNMFKTHVEADHTYIMQRTLDRANQRIQELELENARLQSTIAAMEKQETSPASKLDGLLQQATVQHVDDLRREIEMLQQETKQHSQWTLAIESEFSQAESYLSNLKAYLLTISTRSIELKAWDSICAVSERRLDQLKMELRVAKQHIYEYKISVQENILSQVQEVNGTLAQFTWRDDDSDEPTRRRSSSEKFRKCKIPDCQKGVRSRGLCKGHGGGKRCEEPGCNKSNQGGGYCIAHGGGKRCGINGCKNAAQRQGYCKSHRCRLEDDGVDE